MLIDNVQFKKALMNCLPLKLYLHILCNKTVTDPFSSFRVRIYKTTFVLKQHNMLFWKKEYKQATE